MMTNIEERYKNEFIDFSGGNTDFNDLASIQQAGSIALFNILNKNKNSIAYLADEVGMGKTFIALGTVMLMRYLNPSLRVLFIAPNRQLKDQWIEEYQRFIKNHVNLSHGHVKSLSGESAVEYANCNSLKEIITKTTSGYFADYFVQMNSFSFAMSSKSEDDDNDFYEKKLNQIKEEIPAYTDEILSNHKNIESNDEVKQHYALALNYLLPKFDLIVVDEAHKFKNGVRTSTRNQMLSLILGTSDKGISKSTLTQEQKDIQKELSSKVLLLSATPFDRSLHHIRNQIELFSGKALAQTYFPIDDKGKIKISINKDKNILKQTLKAFLVRRLNKVKIGEDLATRNMYRVEHRDNAIELNGFQNKLVMALVQKHVGDLVEDKQTSSPSFQMGMLASFESFADSSGVRVFDGDDKINDGEDQAKDANLIQKLNESYKNANLGMTMPHPKMDEVVNNHSGDIFANGEKHLFFVRRVKSVSELVNKWNYKYNEWLIKYLKSNNNLDWDSLYEEYKNSTPSNTKPTEDSDKDEESDLETEDIKTDTFFSWFFKGKNLGQASSKDIPFKDFKIKMTKKEDKFSLYFELNLVSKLLDSSKVNDLIGNDLFKKAYLSYIKMYNIKRQDKVNYFNRFHAAQFAALKCLNNENSKDILNIMYADISIEDINGSKDFDTNIIREDLSIRSIFNELKIIEGKDYIKMFILKELLLTQFRQDHIMIDLYISLLNKDEMFIETFMSMYNAQSEKCSQKSDERNELTTYAIINNVKLNIKLICETSLQKYTREVNELIPKGLINSYNRNKQRINLSPLDPIIGVSGDTGNKSEPARKFRLPGYPIVMIATDVMQEGVNLHTFCRSVTHYGLSGTPIHMEQKNGRVDRINSITHRKIQSGKFNTLSAFHDEKIQVRFPFVKQSYESFQVRKLSTNMNDYLASLHDIEVESIVDEKIYIEKELHDKSPIPKAYTEFLETPFEIADNQKVIPEELFNIIENKTKETNALIVLLSKYCENVFSESIDYKAVFLSGKKVKVSYMNKSLYMQLKPAKSNGEFLLELTTCLNDEDEKCNTVELLVGSSTYCALNDEKLTHENEIIGAIERLFEVINLNGKEAIGENKVKYLIEYWGKETTIPFARNNNTKFEFINTSVVFTTEGTRNHTIKLYSLKVCNREYLLFYTKVSKKITDQNDKLGKIVDIVKFETHNDYIVGYVLHDIKYIKPKEFMYCAYILAMEADLFEYQLSIEDQF